MLHDLKYAYRSLRHTPGFTAAAIVTLALGIGANGALFSILDALLLKALPVERASELVVLGRGGYSYPSFLRFSRRTDIFTNLFASSGVSRADIRIDGTPAEHADISLVSGTFFSTLGVGAYAGRAFGPTDDQVGGPPVAVVSYHFWQTRFGLDPNLIGRVVSVNRTPVTIVGVTPPSFFGESVGAAPDLWIPLSMWSQAVPGRDLLKSQNTAWLRVIGRMPPTVDRDRAAAALTLELRSVLTETFGPRIPADVRPYIQRAVVGLEPAARGVSSLREPFGRPVQLLMGAVVVVLLVACANLANMLLIRGVSRRRAMGIQLAMGIGRGRLIRTVLAESALLAFAGTALSLPVARWTSQLLLRLISEGPVPVPLLVSFDWRVLLYTAVLSVITVVAVGLIPAVRSTRVDVLASLKQTTAGVSGRSGPGAVLLAGQVSCAVVLLVAAALLARTLGNLTSSDLGYSSDRLVIVDVDPRTAGYAGERYRALVARLLDRLRTVPGVTAVTQTENGVLTGRDSSTDRMRPASVLSAEGLPQERFDVVGPDYFRTLGIRIIAGRDIQVTDRSTSPRIMIVNEAMAKQYFPGVEPIGQRMLWRDDTPWEIVGVVADVKQTGPRDPQPLRFYIAYSQATAPELASVRYAVRTQLPAPAIAAALRAAVANEDAALSINTIDSASDLLARALTRDRAVTVIASVFAALTAAIAALGLYAMLGYRVARRRPELAVRSAVGARPIDLAGLVMADSARVVSVGLFVGIAGALAASRLLQGLLFDLSPTDAATYIAVVAGLAVVALVASYGPARAAARAEPLAALRGE
jgi:predicted permease